MCDNIWNFKQLNGQEKKLGEFIKEINNIITHTPQSNFNEADANIIFGSVWLGNIHAAHDFNFVTSERIKYIINATSDIENKFPFIHYQTLPITDINACYKNFIQMIEDGADIIYKAICENKPILVHCKRGHHRSASVVAFYLMKYHNMSLIDAICMIKKARPTTFRRMTCLLQTLIHYEYSRVNLLHSR